MVLRYFLYKLLLLYVHFFFFYCVLKEKEMNQRKRKTQKFQRRFAPRKQMEVVEGRAFNLIRCAIVLTHTHTRPAGRPVAERARSAIVRLKG